MATIEQVEKLREKANVTYEDAKTALEASNGDMLEAIIHLEKAGKIDPPKNNGQYSSKTESEEQKSESANSSYYYEGETIPKLIKRFGRWVGKMIYKGNRNSFEVRKGGNVIISLPVTVLVLLLILAFWVVVPIIIVGLFFGCRYFFKGPDLENTGVNNVMNSAANAAENFKQEIKDNKSDTK